MTRVRTGLEVFLERRCAPVRGLRVGLLTHGPAVDASYRAAAQLLRQSAGVCLTTLFGPEHGLEGVAQDLEGVAAGRDPLTGLPVVSLYGQSFDSLRPTPEQLAGLDALVIDLVDVGSRYYTFQATALYCLQAAAEARLPVVVLDRPNPLAGLAVEGPTVRPGFTSFVGVHPIATRHGMTIGELATFYRSRLNLDVDLTVVPCEGWRRAAYHDQTGLPWVLPSPNMPTPDTALVYPGQCLLEGTNLSEGRGTTRPFELCGAPGIDAAAVARRLTDEGLPGVAFRPAWFKPTFQKHAGRTCGGVQLHVTDRESFRPVRTGFAVLAALRDACPAFRWRTETYEFVSDVPAIDLLFGSDRERLGLEAGRPWAEIAAEWVPEEEEFRAGRASALLYDGGE
ncbi:MAG: exo-beta-N-acetylmuramidase NamZ family protein [Gemmataceae bacterium]